jgi:hypothetical protein
MRPDVTRIPTTEIHGPAAERTPEEGAEEVNGSSAHFDGGPSYENRSVIMPAARHHNKTKVRRTLPPQAGFGLRSVSSRRLNPV